MSSTTGASTKTWSNTPVHETYPNGVSEHAVQATAFGPDVLEANMVPIIWGLASKNLDQLTSYTLMSLALTSTRNPWTQGNILLCTWLKLQLGDSFFVVFHPLEINWVCTLWFWHFLANFKSSSFDDARFAQLADSRASACGKHPSVHIGSSSYSWMVDSFLAPIFSCSILRTQAFTQARL